MTPATHLPVERRILSAAADTTSLRGLSFTLVLAGNIEYGFAVFPLSESAAAE